MRLCLTASAYLLPCIIVAAGSLAGCRADPVWEPARASFTGKAATVDFTAEPRTEDGLAFLDKSPETKCEATTVNGERVMRGTGYAYFSLTAPEFKRGGLPLVRLTVEYLDTGGETLSLQYDSSDPNVNPGPQAGVWKGRSLAVLRNSKQWRTAEYVIPDGQFTNRCNGGDLRFSLGGDAWVLRRLTVTAAAAPDQERDRQALAARVVVPSAASKPFDLTREQVLAKLGPYTGPSIHKTPVATLTGKLVCGYQGWHGTPTDGAGLGWVHYAEHGTFVPGDCHIEYWPDTSELDPAEKYATAFRKADGSVAYVYSAYNAKTVIRHFKWMADYGIDGAFVQRFVGAVRGPADLNKNNAVLMSAREGANRYGRSYNVMYDFSGAGDCGDVVIDDWKNLVDRMHLTRDPGDKAYQRHNGKPVVTLWGLFADRADQHAAFTKVIDFLKNDPKYGGCEVMLGTNNDWRTNRRPAGQAVLRICETADIISPWMVGRFGNPEGAKAFIAAHNVPDQQWCNERGKEYMPVIFPGFSWANMHDGLTPRNAIPRLKGQFLWTQALATRAAGAKMLYVAMFDEMDEGTAIFKCDPNPPIGETKFLDFEGLPSDYYLWLTGQVGRLLRGETEGTEAVPGRG